MSQQLCGPSILGLVGDMSGPTLWRCLWPFTALQKRGYRADWDFKDARGIGEIAPFYDGYVLPRMSWAPKDRWMAEAWFEMIRRAGKFAVYDCDDDLFGTELDRRSVAMGWAGTKTADDLEAERQERIWAMQQCDGVTVSTQRLATIARGLTTRPVIVVPNAIDISWFRRVLRGAQRQVAAPTIGWAGGKRPDDDLLAVAEAWRRIAARFPQVRFVVAGYLSPALKAAVPADRLHVVPWMALERYPATLRDVDIACASVSNTPFNRSKSAIKIFEAALAGAAVVASPTIYGAVIQHGYDGFIAETADEWEDALAQLVDSHALRQILARRLLKVVERKHSLQTELWRWPAAWSAIAEDAAARRSARVSDTIGVRNASA